jgi:acyl carrier protein
MTEEEIRGKVYEVFEESFEVAPGDLSPEVKVFEDLGLDSLDIVDLIVALQKKFGVRIRDNEGVRQIRTVGDICTFIGRVTDADVVE